VAQQIDRLVSALADGAPASSIRERLAALEERKALLGSELSASTAPAPRLHPGLAELYREKVSALAEALASDDAGEAREVIRGLVEEIRLVPEADKLRIEVRGELGAILRLAEGAQTAKRPGRVAEAFALQVKLDAGTRKHLDLLLKG
jgi:hypothetical protein